VNTNPHTSIHTAYRSWGKWFLVSLLFIAMGAQGCNHKGESKEEWVVLAPASMIDILPKIAQDWEAAGNPPIRFRFDATSRLARQIEHGAPADLFVSADRRWMNHLIASGDIPEESVLPLAENTLVAITHKDNALQAENIGDLQRNEVTRIVLAGAQVPVGRYARDALKNKELLATLQSKIIAGTSARHVLTLVERQEGDVGFVYATDAHSSNDIRVLFSLSPDAGAPIEYLGGFVRGGDKRAKAFLQYLHTTTARKALLKAGFMTPPRRTP
jgi:molybdate transport system substrate-binding protein